MGETPRNFLFEVTTPHFTDFSANCQLCADGFQIIVGSKINVYSSCVTVPTPIAFETVTTTPRKDRKQTHKTGKRRNETVLENVSKVSKMNGNENSSVENNNDVNYKCFLNHTSCEMVLRCTLCLQYEHANCVGYNRVMEIPQYYVCIACRSPKVLHRNIPPMEYQNGLFARNQDQTVYENVGTENSSDEFVDETAGKYNDEIADKYEDEYESENADEYEDETVDEYEDETGDEYGNEAVDDYEDEGVYESEDENVNDYEDETVDEYEEETTDECENEAVGALAMEVEDNGLKGECQSNKNDEFNNGEVFRLWEPPRVSSCDEPIIEHIRNHVMSIQDHISEIWTTARLPDSKFVNPPSLTEQIFTILIQLQTRCNYLQFPKNDQ